MSVLSRRVFRQKQTYQLILKALEMWRSLDVDQHLDLAERYIQENSPPNLMKWARKNVPITQRSFYCCLNLVQWGDCKCR